MTKQEMRNKLERIQRSLRRLAEALNDEIDEIATIRSDITQECLEVMDLYKPYKKKKRSSK